MGSMNAGRAMAVMGAVLVLGSLPVAQAQSEGPAPLVRARGPWSASTHYVIDDVVTARGSAWRARRANTNKVPGSTSPSTAPDWELFAAGFNPLGAWSATKTYHMNDLVTRAGSTWRARRTSLNKTPVAGADWEQFAASGATGPQGPAGLTSAPDGSAGTPSFRFSSSAGTGMFSPSSGRLALVEGGALFLHNIGTANTALGLASLKSNSGNFNTALGHEALMSNSTGINNTGIGSLALRANTTGNSSIALGSGALKKSNGSDNVAVGMEAAVENTTASGNTAVGTRALRANTMSDYNTAVGIQALENITGVNDLGRNIGIGYRAGYLATNATSSIFIGSDGVGGDTNVIRIGVQGIQIKTAIAGIRDSTTPISDAIPVLIDRDGVLGTQNSSRRYKFDIASMDDTSAMLAKLRPVTFRYMEAQDGGAHPIQYGLIAEEVAEVFPDLAVFKDGQPHSVKYHLLPSLLLASYQHQQKMIDMQARDARQQGQTIAAQAAEIASLEQRLRNIEAMLARRAELQSAAHE